jgi:nucleoid DNA-binding protein
MKREELAKTLARQTGLSQSEARNEVDELVRDTLDKLRRKSGPETSTRHALGDRHNVVR